MTNSTSQPWNASQAGPRPSQNSGPLTNRQSNATLNLTIKAVSSKSPFPSPKNPQTQPSLNQLPQPPPAHIYIHISPSANPNSAPYASIDMIPPIVASGALLSPPADTASSTQPESNTIPAPDPETETATETQRARSSRVYYGSTRRSDDTRQPFRRSSAHDVDAERPRRTNRDTARGSRNRSSTRTDVHTSSDSESDVIEMCRMCHVEAAICQHPMVARGRRLCEICFHTMIPTETHGNNAS
ncbi:predicted protein [Uncinocarpus reesii 1704]|uniref:Uncharacterized protein n=1 Tax=Uncinocarpus reesii (strain UAMH 1704) TaxID=336963 RepID=C4JE88_UNCRE|nr:uncharacterized protein UREG_00512 [Uncinocarpus reesii 1704]EEP75666.1 predicted protein [Uncinocarpus reesii 1704]